MRDTEASFRIVQNPLGTASRSPWRGLKVAVAMLSVGLVVSAGAARAADDDEDDKTFEEKIIEGIMTGIGGTNMENRGIEYRERSPLVVPPKLTLPPPATAAEVPAGNWPKDPDAQRRKAAAAARKKDNKDSTQSHRLLTPAELAANKSAPVRTGSNDPIQPGATNTNLLLTPSELGFKGSLGSLFGGNTSETAPFKGEPTRQTLTQPPSGYQTPSPNFAYGTGPKESLNKEYNPAQGKYGE